MTKKTGLTLFLILFISVSTHGQTKWSSEGRIIIGGSQSLSESKMTNSYTNMNVKSIGKATNDITPYIGYQTAPYFILGQTLAFGLDISYTSYSISKFEYSIDQNDGTLHFFTVDFYDEVEYQVLSMKPKISVVLGDEESFIEFGYGYGLTYLNSEDQYMRSKNVSGKTIYPDGTETPYTSPLNYQHEGASVSTRRCKWNFFRRNVIYQHEMAYPISLSYCWKCEV